MSLWLNKKERKYLMALIKDDVVEYPEGDEDFLNNEQREKLLQKIGDMKV
jgi:hypothetical protein